MVTDEKNELGIWRLKVVITQKHVRVDAAILMMPSQTEFGKMADWPDMSE